jgi:multidrug efflux system membrane fusion protein
MTTKMLVTVSMMAAAASNCSAPQAREVQTPQPVKVHVVSEAPGPAAVRYSASIEAFEQVPLAFKAGGYVDDILRRRSTDGVTRLAQAGDTVTKGTVLARVRQADYVERVRQADAGHAEADAALVKARLDLERARVLFEAASLTKPELDAAQASFDAAVARMDSVRADGELARSALADTTLVAPAPGVILERRVEIGSLAAAGTVGFVVADVSAVKARFGIPDAMVSQVRLGDRLRVTVDAIDGATFDGRVTTIAPAANPDSRVFDVEVTIPNRGGQLRPGMIGTVALGPRVSDGQIPRAITVPLTAVTRAAGTANVFSVLVVDPHPSGGVARTRQVELGEVIGDAIAVRRGLTRGERVVISGATMLVDGDIVRVLE